MIAAWVILLTLLVGVLRHLGGSTDSQRKSRTGPLKVPKLEKSDAISKQSGVASVREADFSQVTAEEATGASVEVVSEVLEASDKIGIETPSGNALGIPKIEMAETSRKVIGLIPRSGSAKLSPRGRAGALGKPAASTKSTQAWSGAKWWRSQFSEKGPVTRALSGTPSQFECLICDLFESSGLFSEVRLVAGPREHGADVVAKALGSDLKICVQAKHYRKSMLSIDAVKQAVWARSSYAAKLAIIATTAIDAPSDVRQEAARLCIPIFFLGDLREWEQGKWDRLSRLFRDGITS